MTASPLLGLFTKWSAVCQRQRSKLTSFSPWNAFCRNNALPASSHIWEDPTALFFLHNRPPLRLHFCTKVHHHSISSRTNKEAHFAMSQCVFWYSAAQHLAQTLSTRTLTWSKDPLMAGEGTKKSNAGWRWTSGLKFDGK